MNLKKALLKMDVSALSPVGLRGREYILRDLGVDIKIKSEDPLKIIVEYIKNAAGRDERMVKAARSTRYNTPHYRLIIPVGEGDSGALIFDEDAIKTLFDVVGEDVSGMLIS